MDRLNSVFGTLTVLYAVFIGIAIWRAHRREVARRSGRRQHAERDARAAHGFFFRQGRH